jgi:hypothetical protein
MLADHARKDVRRPHQTGHREAVVTRDGGLLVGHANGCHGNDCVEVWPFGERRQGLHVRHRPDASTHTPSVGVVERIKEMVGITPREIVLDVLMKVLLDRRLRLRVMALQG